MFTRREVAIGKCYVKDNAQIAREVIAELHHRKVVYNAYDLRTGSLVHTPHQICSRKQLIRWADREATREESAKLMRDEATEIFVSGRKKDSNERLHGRIGKIPLHNRRAEPDTTPLM